MEQTWINMEAENPTKASSRPRHCESNHEMLPHVRVISFLILLQGVENNDFKRKQFLSGANSGLIRSNWANVYHVRMSEYRVIIAFSLNRMRITVLTPFIRHQFTYNSLLH